MQTEKDNIPDEREQRGRTPVWENITYGIPFMFIPYMWEALNAAINSIPGIV